MNISPPRGRGTALNPPNRFTPLEFEWDPDLPPDERPAPRTRFFIDHAQTLITTNDSPDIPFTHSVNPYRGCEHGCIYCYARPTHEYTGHSSGLDFESIIFVKIRAPDLLAAELRKRPPAEPLAFSGVTDCYQPAERHFRLTRQCLAVCNTLRHPVSLITKSRLITRDLDLLTAMAARQQVAVAISLTTLDQTLARHLEPRAASPEARLQTIRTLAEAGVPVGVMTAPIIPGLNDHEIPALLDAARQAGASYAGWVLLRLPHAVEHLFFDWVRTHYPEREQKIRTSLGALRGGKMTTGTFGSRMMGEGPAAVRLAQWFDVARRRAGYQPWHLPLVMPSIAIPQPIARVPQQLELF